MREWWSKICRLAKRRRGLDDDLGEEMRSHLDFMIEDNIARGMTPEDARTSARRHFGNQTVARERAQESWRFPTVETILQDVRYGLRGIRRSPSFSLVIILTLALGIGANTAIFSVVYAVLLRPLPYPAGERLVSLGESTPKAPGFSVTWINYQHWRSENHSFEDMAGFQTGDMTMTGRGQALLTHCGVVTSSFFHLTGSRPILGRLFTEADDKPGATPTVLLAYEFWAKTLDGQSGVLGQTLALNGRAYEIVGVLPPELKFFSRPVDYYVPLGPSAGKTVKRSQHASMNVLALLKPGVTLADGRTDLNTIMQRLATADPGPEDDHRTSAEYFSEAKTGSIKQTLFVLMGAVSLLLVIACANVGSLLLVRSTARIREIAIRTAIGAGRMRLARQLLTENLVISAIGGGVGLLLASWCLQALVQMGPKNIPRLSEVKLDMHVLLFGAAVTAVVGLLAGLAPVFAAGRVDIGTALKDGSPGSGSGKLGQSFRGALIIAEIAITLILSFASGLLLRSLIAAQSADPGFDPKHVLALELQLPSSSYKGDIAVRQFYNTLMQNLRAEAGVQAVGAVNCPPSAGSCGDWWYSIVGAAAPARGDVPLSLFNTADTSYFSAVRIPILAGRGFTDVDRKGGTRVAVVNEEVARKWWPTPQMAIGQQIKMGGPYMEGPTLEIVGVTGNVSQTGLDTAPLPEIYFPFSQRADEGMVVMIRIAGDPSALLQTVRHHVGLMDRNLPIQSLQTMETRLGAKLERRRFSTLLLTLFAALAMFLAAVGIYGVLNYWVTMRQKEIAVRLALGAQRSAILRWAGSHAVWFAAVGIVLGAFGAWGASRFLNSMVFGVSVTDPGVMVAASATVIAIAALAASIPLWRATRVDAVSNLHDA